MNQISIKEFYKGKNIFITGATGFVGKALVEKLLWSCPDLENIFIIVRSKKGKEIQERLEEILNCPSFNRIRVKNPEILKKIIPLAGDITKENLGMSEEDLERFYEKVNVIFHSAASINLNEPIKDALNNNTVPTKRLIGMAKNVKNLDAFVHVSTAYSHYYMRKTFEVPYLPSYDPNDILEVAQNLPDNIHEKVKPFLLNIRNGDPIISLDKVPTLGILDSIPGLKGTRPFPNSYTFSKYFAEAFVVLEGEGIKRAIVRPSIVISALKEPMPGWIDNWAGPTDRLVQASNGTIHYISADPNLNLDLVPVDFAVNCIIAAGWKVALEESTDVQIFGASTAAQSPMNIGELFRNILENARKIPYGRVMSWPSLYISHGKIASAVCPLLFHTIPAHALDIARKVRRKKPVMVKLNNFIDNLYNIVKFVAVTPSHFDTQNAQRLAATLSQNDQKEFPFDARLINWKEYLKDYSWGVKKYLLKEDCGAEAIMKGQQKLRRLKLVHNGFKYTFIAGSLLLAGSLLRYKFNPNKEECGKTQNVNPFGFASSENQVHQTSLL